ncbi:hypothetical protein SUGI_0483170 [Cryptomeria japonica]|uniref:CASP-like protein 1U1 n=1 Tax=Cryptomeria japonica TaxID=3369 RepID=UPI0024089F47|nr:CASP-like protein 1U1 [Cryptomeria japonica]GLJ25241.1 hypothetical protein SUGI_0483170 [Cryptomeria japonica]
MAESAVSSKSKEGIRMAGWDVVIRGIAFAATISATIVMATNKQTKTIPLPLNPAITIPVTAKFHYTPAFVFFVAVNGIACGYALVTLISSVVVKHVLKSKHTDLHECLVGLLDLVTVATLSAGASAAAAISEVGKNGNKHSQWNKICDKVGRFCDRGGGALIASFAGVLAFMLLSHITTYSLYKRSRKLSSAPPEQQLTQTPCP